jgi:transcription elongation factor GreA
MNAAQPLLLTEDGWPRLHDELDRLRALRRSTMSEYLLLSRSAELDQTTSEQLHDDISVLDGRILHLAEMLSRAVPAGGSHAEPGAVGVGSHVTVRWDDGEQESYVIVGPPEVDPRTGRISYQSPVGQALVGRRPGDSVEAATPGGVQRLTVIEVA